jgi:hypothetical protein
MLTVTAREQLKLAAAAPVPFTQRQGGQASTRTACEPALSIPEVMAKEKVVELKIPLHTLTAAQLEALKANNVKGSMLTNMPASTTAISQQHEFLLIHECKNSACKVLVWIDQILVNLWVYVS